jgi:hypothetical protein
MAERGRRVSPTGENSAHPLDPRGGAEEETKRRAKTKSEDEELKDFSYDREPRLGSSGRKENAMAEKPDGIFTLEPTPRPRHLPPDVELSVTWVRYAQITSRQQLRTQWDDAKIGDEFESFRIYHWRHGTKANNWYAAWMYWVRIACKREAVPQRPRGMEF